MGMARTIWYTVWLPMIGGGAASGAARPALSPADDFRSRADRSRLAR
jgi:hypothetical protein